MNRPVIDTNIAGVIPPSKRRETDARSTTSMSIDAESSQPAFARSAVGTDLLPAGGIVSAMNVRSVSERSS